MNDDFISRLLLSIHGIAEEDLRRPEASGRWSILDVVAHLADFEQFTASRLRLMLALDAPSLPGFDQEALVASHRGDAFADLIEQLSFFRRMNLALAARLTAAQRDRAGIHATRGRLTIAELMEFARAHQEKHLGQIERIKQTLALAASDAPQIVGAERGDARGAKTRTFGDVLVRDLWQGGAKRALEVEFPAGAQWPGLDHHVPGPEEVYVVRGDFQDGGVAYGPGTFLHYPAGSSHTPRSTEGCTLFVFYPEG